MIAGVYPHLDPRVLNTAQTVPVSASPTRGDATVGFAPACGHRAGIRLKLRSDQQSDERLNVEAVGCPIQVEVRAGDVCRIERRAHQNGDKGRNIIDVHQAVAVDVAGDGRGLAGVLEGQEVDEAGSAALRRAGHDDVLAESSARAWPSANSVGTS